MVDGVVVEILGRDSLLDDLIENLFAEELGGDVVAVLSRDDNGVDTNGDDGTVVVLVLNGDLGLGVGTEPRETTITASGRHGGVQLVGEQQGKREELRGFVGGISEHDTLITGTKIFEALVELETLRNIGRLLLNGDSKMEGLVVKTLGRVIVADILDNIADNLLVVELGLGGDLTKDHNHTSLGRGLASDLGEGIICQAGVKDGVRDLITDLVRMAFTYRLGLWSRKVSNKQWPSLQQNESYIR